MTPGPVQIHPAIGQKLAQQPPHHRSPEAQALFKDIRWELQSMLRAPHPPILVISSGTGLMETLLLNLQPQSTVGFIISGKFGKRWLSIAQKWGYPVAVFEQDPQEPFHWENFDRFLLQNSMEVLCLQSVDTSTGYLLDVPTLSQKVRNRRPETLILVDSVTSWGCLPVDWEQWNVDALIGASQKGFMLPAGLGLMAVSSRYLSVSRQRKPAIFTWDVVQEFAWQNQHHEMRWSAPMAHLQGMHEALKILKGPDYYTSHYRQVESQAQAWRRITQILGWPTLPRQTAPSVSVTVLEPSKPFIERLKIKGFWVADGQGEWENRLVRVGHMGFCDAHTWEAFLKAVWETAQELGFTLPSWGDFRQLGQWQPLWDSFQKAPDPS